MSNGKSDADHAWNALGELQQIDPEAHSQNIEGLHDRALEIVEDLAIELGDSDS